MNRPAPHIAVELTREPIAHERLVDDARSKSCGAIVLFLGTVREMTRQPETGQTRQTLSLVYEAHEPLALAELQRLAQEAARQFGLESVLVVHRLGEQQLAETAIALCTASAHRKDAFTGAMWLMDRIKETVPIWKQEHWAEGTSAWVHPGQAAAQEAPR